MESKNWIDIGALVLGLVAALTALVQWRRDQAWKRANKLDALFKEFNSRRQILIACRILDWSYGKFKLSSSDEFSFTAEDVKKSLAVHGSSELTFTQTQTRMRDAYDVLLSFFERLETAIDAGLVDQDPAMNLFGYWVRHFAEMPEHPECAEDAIRYVERYSNKLSFFMLYWRASKKNLSERQNTFP